MKTKLKEGLAAQKETIRIFKTKFGEIKIKKLIWTKA